jgi:hypothetical protein
MGILKRPYYNDNRMAPHAPASHNGRRGMIALPPHFLIQPMRGFSFTQGHGIASVGS